MAPTTEKAVWRSVSTTSGVQCVTMAGAILMLRLSADSWDSPPPTPLLLGQHKGLLPALEGPGWIMCSALEMRLF